MSPTGICPIERGLKSKNKIFNDFRPRSIRGIRAEVAPKNLAPQPRCDVTEVTYDIALLLDISLRGNSLSNTSWSDVSPFFALSTIFTSTIFSLKEQSRPPYPTIVPMALSI
jgi:hypothetical protein